MVMVWLPDATVWTAKVTFVAAKEERLPVQACVETAPPSICQLIVTDVKVLAPKFFKVKDGVT